MLNDKRETSNKQRRAGVRLLGSVEVPCPMGRKVLLQVVALLPRLDYVSSIRHITAKGKFLVSIRDQTKTLCLNSISTGLRTTTAKPTDHGTYLSTSVAAVLCRTTHQTKHRTLSGIPCGRLIGVSHDCEMKMQLNETALFNSSGCSC